MFLHIPDLKYGVCRVQKANNATGPSVLDLRFGTATEQLTHKRINKRADTLGKTQWCFEGKLTSEKCLSLSPRSTMERSIDNIHFWELRTQIRK